METFLVNFFWGNEAVASLALLWIKILLSVVALCFIVSEISRNYSQVDKLWSLMPGVYAIVTLAHYPDSARVWIMALLTIAWGARLTWNFARKGGYSIIPWRGEEDYRWSVLREKPILKGRIKFGIFNLVFISFYQQFLIMLFSTPLLVAATHPERPLSWLDIVAAILIVGFLTLETVADNQLFSFQKQKKGLAEKEKRFENSHKCGFMCDGLFSVSRHPNWLGEQSIWVSFYLFSISASGVLINWSIAGAALLLMLFQGSAWITEGISKGKYPEYVNYIKRVPKFIPKIF
jgi:steroid 5-alpha reductase family enzyme